MQTASLMQTKPMDISESAHVEGVPFFPQQDHQCGPASLAMALNHAGASLSPDLLRSGLFVPGREGSLQVEMLALPRRYGYVAYPLIPQLGSILRAVEAGHPVVVLQNLGLSVAPQWHYAVVTGFDLAKGSIRLHSGETPDYQLALSTFERTWKRAGSWAMVAHRAGELPVAVTENAYFRAVTVLEHSRKREALLAYVAATRRWPRSLAAWMGVGNSRYALADLKGAAEAFIKASKADPLAAEPLNNLAQIRMEQGDLDAAMALADQAIERDKQSVLYLQTRDEVIRARANAARSGLH
ncbi:PA2778 family cysteine peptidase [Mariprofundus ferrooxydans]|uniref:TPR repeat protein n=2 Tax=Mariprofundus ferrooxydans TaxID=314344 RepID=Q0F2X5_9PROT|nr:PA2778 family cysteine peptidase [Mariprofundus ferrooxydans]EAU56166.1 TPR repeat protein [Mariprofundus ferrooxydans PV-1]KON48066.1 hypothetical protein AL013_04770 [Mariprofundus ferrooxydans]